MGLFLRSAEVTRLQSAIRVLASPFACADIDAWRQACWRATRELLGADRAGFVLPLAGEPLLRYDPALTDAITVWEQHYYRLDTGFTDVRRARRLTVFHLYDLYPDPAALARSEFYHDWLRRYRCANTIAMAVDLDAAGTAASIHCYGGRRTPDLSDRAPALLGLVWPAFEVGVRTVVRFAGLRSRLAAFFDTTPDGVLLMDFSGRVLHRTPALERVLAADPERQRVDAAMRHSVLGLAPVARRKTAPDAAAAARAVRLTVRTAHRSYQVRATALAGVFGFDEAVGVAWVEMPARWQPGDDELRDRFGLTPREAEVARHLAAGRSNAELAARLGISVHTARRHVERVFDKLQVRKRAAVGPRLVV